MERGVEKELPDRDLTETETRKFLEEREIGKIFKALRVFAEEKTKPTLHDLCIIELSAKIDGMTRIIIELGREIKRLKESHAVFGC